jgi:hypothetical protein
MKRRLGQGFAVLGLLADLGLIALLLCVAGAGQIDLVVSAGGGSAAGPANIQAACGRCAATWAGADVAAPLRRAVGAVARFLLGPPMAWPKLMLSGLVAVGLFELLFTPARRRSPA